MTPAPRAVTLAVGPVEPSAFTGRVVYGPGRAVDQPVSVTRYEYTDNPAGTALVWPRVTWAVLWDYRGSPVAGLYTSGAWQRPYAPGPTQSECAPLGAPGLRRCLRVQWAMTQTAYDRAKDAVAPVAWHGSLLAQQRDGSGLEAKRARLYDPATGRFTQEDPIGLAGGLNLYGYANGDPVNFSDPFGLCPDPNDLLCQAFESGFTLLGGTLGFIGGGGLGLLELAGTGGLAAPAAVATAAGATAAGAGLGQAVGRQLSNVLFSESARSRRGSKSADEYDRHARGVQRAREQVGELEGQLTKAKGPKAQRPIAEQIERLRREIRGHEKEMRQKWPDGRPQ